MSQTQHNGPLPTLEDVESLLRAAREAVKYRYQSPEHSYVQGALCKLFTNAIGWLYHDTDPVEVLLDTLQDERSVLNRHNRLQAKALFTQEKVYDLSENVANFPFRFLVLNTGVKLPTKGLEPIYQIKDDPKKMEAAREARENTLVRLQNSSSSTTTDLSPNSFTNSIGSSQGPLCDAPAPEHELPDGNITLAEIAAFLPQSFKCWDIIDRIVWNGATSEDIAALINKYREMPGGKIKINTAYMMMRGQMRKRTREEHNYEAWKSWTVGAHQDVEKPGDFDPHSISVTDFRRPTIFKSRPAEAAKPIPFKDLANGVVTWPEHGDALDLTRCVAWCSDNLEEEYFYPTDFQKVLNECLGGPVVPKARHTDAEVLLRLRSGTETLKTWRRTNTHTHNNDANSDSSAKEPAAQLGKRKRTKPSDSSRRKKVIVKSARHCRTTHKSNARSTSYSSFFHLGDDDSEDDIDDDAYRGPKRARKNKGAPRRSVRNETKTVSYTDDTTQMVGEELEIEDGIEDEDLEDEEQVYDDEDMGDEEMNIDEY